MSNTRLFLWSLIAAYAWALVLSFAWQSGLVTRLAMPLLHQHESHKIQAASIELAARKAPLDYIILGDSDFQKRIHVEGELVRILIPRMNLAQVSALLKASTSFNVRQIIVQNRPDYWANGVLYGAAPNQTLWNISQGKGYQFNAWPIGDIRLLFDLMGDLATIPYTPTPTSVASCWINQEWRFDAKRQEYFSEPLSYAQKILWIADQTRQPDDSNYHLAERFKREMAQNKTIKGLGTFAAKVK